jgi:hypothetical protein
MDDDRTILRLREASNGGKLAEGRRRRERHFDNSRKVYTPR